MQQNIEQALRGAASFLRSCGVEAPRSEAEYLLSFVLKQGRAFLYAHGNDPLTDAQLCFFRALTGRRGQREPLAYLTGEKEFMGVSFRVSPGVLIPRPETEQLALAAIQGLCRAHPGALEGQGLNLLDLGTGCGNIAIMLALHFPGAAVTGVDFSGEAVRVARQNALLHGVQERVTFFCSAYWDSFTPGADRFQGIVANPPYIPRKEMAALMAEVQKEPREALDGGPDGLESFREILPEARQYLDPPGLLALEIGAGQAGEVIALGESAGLSLQEVLLDYGGRERVLTFDCRAGLSGPSGSLSGSRPPG